MSSYGLYDYTFRLVIIGDCSVGKTAFTGNIIGRGFAPEHQTTIGVDYGSTIIKVKNDTVSIKCQLWDTAGQETFAPLIASYYKDIAGVMIFFDVSCRRSFLRVKFWLNEFYAHRNSNIPVPILLVGNKIDIFDRQVSYKEGKYFANKYGLLYEEISVKCNVNIRNTLSVLCNKIYDTKETNPGVKEHAPIVKLNDDIKYEKFDYDCCTIA
tara:strand:+ start:12 stop:644 length:633 start_codon:yes stop_codon:yes gene_type:complete